MAKSLNKLNRSLLYYLIFDSHCSSIYYFSFYREISLSIFSILFLFLSSNSWSRSVSSSFGISAMNIFDYWFLRLYCNMAIRARLSSHFFYNSLTFCLWAATCSFYFSNRVSFSCIKLDALAISSILLLSC